MITFLTLIHVMTNSLYVSSCFMSLQALCLFMLCVSSCFMRFFSYKSSKWGYGLDGDDSVSELSSLDPCMEVVICNVLSTSFELANARATITLYFSDKNNDSSFILCGFSSVCAWLICNQSFILSFFTNLVLNFLHHLIMILLDNDFISTPSYGWVIP